eukprot:4897932-Alexandrium_andersonii.AAC.1
MACATTCATDPAQSAGRSLFPQAGTAACMRTLRWARQPAVRQDCYVKMIELKRENDDFKNRLE